jgi:hypothetical protein
MRAPAARNTGVHNQRMVRLTIMAAALVSSGQPFGPRRASSSRKIDGARRLPAGFMNRARRERRARRSPGWRRRPRLGRRACRKGSDESRGSAGRRWPRARRSSPRSTTLRRGRRRMRQRRTLAARRRSGRARARGAMSPGSGPRTVCGRRSPRVTTGDRLFLGRSHRLRRPEALSRRGPVDSGNPMVIYR